MTAVRRLATVHGFKLPVETLRFIPHSGKARMPAPPMTAEVIPFARNASEAWDAYMALMREASDDPALLADGAHLARRIAAHRRFFILFNRECFGSRNARPA